ncbi:hypothetical protein ACH42_16260 [Endozoicomonas sp. (ex Bugula neritina AB1)]|nr:hypothetical protein ACH42_16260 [Endozoicomonas sp. (ex Bugula neritina AB1)]
MGQGLKQRLLGVVVLLGLLVLLAPAFFQGGESHPLATTESSVSQAVAPKVPEFVQSLDIAPESTSVLPPDIAETYYDNRPGNDTEGYLKAWTLQLATFSDKKNAKRLENDLKEKGYTAYTQQFQSKKEGYLYRVFVGPEVQMDDLLKLKKELDKEYKVTSLIVKFTP